MKNAPPPSHAPEGMGWQFYVLATVITLGVFMLIARVFGIL
jgi:hypothetical protein